MLIIHGGGGDGVLTGPLGGEEGRGHRKIYTSGTKTVSSL